MQHKCQQSAPSRSTGRARTEEVTSLISIQLPGVVFCRANQSLTQHGKLSHHAAQSSPCSCSCHSSSLIDNDAQAICRQSHLAPLSKLHASACYACHFWPYQVSVRTLCSAGLRVSLVSDESLSERYLPIAGQWYNYLLAPAGDSAADHLDLAGDLQGRFSARSANMTVRHRT